jgi:1,4-alpha-glucan branching enzyme
VPRSGRWRERLNSDADLYGGSGAGNAGEVASESIGHHGHPQSLVLTVPPLGFLLLEPS